MATEFGLTAVLNSLHGRRADFVENLRLCRDVPQIQRYKEAVVAFDEQIAHVENAIAAARREQMAVAS